MRTLFCRGGLADIALASRFLQHVLHLDQLSLVVLHVLDERASGVVGDKDLIVDKLFGEVLSEEGGEGGGGDVLGGEPEDVYDLSARIELGRAFLDWLTAIKSFNFRHSAVSQEI